MVADNLAQKLRRVLSTTSNKTRAESSGATSTTPGSTGDLHADDVEASKLPPGMPTHDDGGSGSCEAEGGRARGGESSRFGKSGGSRRGGGADKKNPPRLGGAQEGPSQGVSGKPAGSAALEARDWKAGQTFPLLPGRLSFAVHQADSHTKSEIKLHPNLFFFSSDFQERYEPFCADFGPVNLGIVHSFCAMMESFMTDKRILTREIVYYSSASSNFCSNAAFLLSAYLVVHHGKTPKEAWAPFETMLDSPIVPFRDASFLPDSYQLTVLSCLEGLHKAISLGWYDPANFDLEEYDYLDNPKHADMHFMSPHTAAFKGPSNHTRQVLHGVFTFSPRHYSKLFSELGISGVVRLNEATTYRRSVFAEGGFDHLDCYFDDCTIPPNAVIQRFLDFCETQKGGVAVHCKAGLGRTGTVIGVWFMKKFGFTASECIGWMRIVRPGSVIGPQKQYLHWAEKQFVPDPSGKGLLWRPKQEPTEAKECEFDESQSAEMGLAMARAQNVRAGARLGQMMPVGEESDEDEEQAEEEMFRKVLTDGKSGQEIDVKG